MDNWLPDIIQDVTARASAVLESRVTDPFELFFDKGNISQVSQSVAANNNSFPLLWFKMPFSVSKTNALIYGEASIDLILLMSTEPNYTQQQREDLVYTKRLLPAYDAFLFQLGRDKRLSYKSAGKVEHTQTIMPFWGGGEGNAPSQPNLFKKNMDALGIMNIKLTIQKSC